MVAHMQPETGGPGAWKGRGLLVEGAAPAQMVIGLMLLGFAHLIETGLFVLFNLELHVNEIIHRLIVMAGFVFVIWGFIIMRQAFEK